MCYNAIKKTFAVLLLNALFLHSAIASLETDNTASDYLGCIYAYKNQGTNQCPSGTERHITMLPGHFYFANKIRGNAYSYRIYRNGQLSLRHANVDKTPGRANNHYHVQPISSILPPSDWDYTRNGPYKVSVRLFEEPSYGGSQQETTLYFMKDGAVIDCTVFDHNDCPSDFAKKEAPEFQNARFVMATTYEKNNVQNTLTGVFVKVD